MMLTQENTQEIKLEFKYYKDNSDDYIPSKELIEQFCKKGINLCDTIEALRGVLEQAKTALKDADCKCSKYTIPGHFEAAPEISSTAGEYVAEKTAVQICKRCKALTSIDRLDVKK